MLNWIVNTTVYQWIVDNAVVDWIADSGFYERITANKKSVALAIVAVVAFCGGIAAIVPGNAMAQGVEPAADAARPRSEPQNERSAAEKVFTPPAPVTMEQSPMAVATKTAKERIDSRIASIRNNLGNYTRNYQSRNLASQEFLKLTDDLTSLIDQARADADFYRRTAIDLVNELVFLEKGLRYLAGEVTSRSDKMDDSKLQSMNVGSVNSDYLKQADDMPARIATTRGFIKDMEASGRFLADANASLAIVKTYVLVTQAGSGPPKIDGERVEVLRQSLVDFVDLVDKFTKQVDPAAPASDTKTK